MLWEPDCLDSDQRYVQTEPTEKSTGPAVVTVNGSTIAYIRSISEAIEEAAVPPSIRTLKKSIRSLKKLEARFCHMSPDPLYLVVSPCEGANYMLWPSASRA